MTHQTIVIIVLAVILFSLLGGMVYWVYFKPQEETGGAYISQSGRCLGRNCPGCPECTGKCTPYASIKNNVKTCHCRTN